MAKPLNLEEDTMTKSIGSLNSKSAHRSTQIPLYLFLSAIFISFLYFSNFHISPATLLKDTKFWFFLSNFIILIVAVDSGALCSSKKSTDLYEEYLKYNRSRNNSYVTSLPETCQKSDIKACPKTSQENVTENLCHFKYSPRNSVNRVAVATENTKAVGRWETAKAYRRSEDSEFWAMSDEELNRRAEEFIKRFNREIRLQEMYIS